MPDQTSIDEMFGRLTRSQAREARLHAAALTALSHLLRAERVEAVEAARLALADLDEGQRISLICAAAVLSAVTTETWVRDE